MEEIKYPIYYAIEPMYNPINCELIGCIVSKCFVLEENKKYFVNGAIKADYKVVFPYQEIDAFGNIKLESIFPNDSNITHVNSIFESYLDAKRECFFRNACCSEYQRLKLEGIEDQITQATEALIVYSENSDSNDSKLQKLKVYNNTI